MIESQVTVESLESGDWFEASPDIDAIVGAYRHPAPLDVWYDYDRQTWMTTILVGLRTRSAS